MRYITIPQAVQVSTPQGPREYSFATFVEEHICTDVRWRKEWGESYAEIVKKLQTPPNTLTAEFTDEEHERISLCAVETQRIPVPVQHLLMPFIHAITLAPNKKK